MPFNKECFDAAVAAINEHEIMVTPAFDGGARVMVLRDDSDTQTKGGLVIPDQAQKRKRTGTVVATSERAEGDPYYAAVAVGKRVSFNAYEGTLHAIPTSIGQVEVVVMHISQLYLTWRSTEVAVDSQGGTEKGEV